jgi:hypothetical protein
MCSEALRYAPMAFRSNQCLFSSLIESASPNCLSGTQFSQDTMIRHCPPPMAFWILLYALLKYDVVSMQNFYQIYIDSMGLGGRIWEHKSTIDVSASS